MPNQQVKEIIAFSAGRYKENRAARPDLAKAYLTIMNHAIDVHLNTKSISAMANYLSKPRTDPDMAKACKEVLEHLGTAP